jgi:hypothetical protein
MKKIYSLVFVLAVLCVGFYMLSQKKTEIPSSVINTPTTTLETVGTITMLSDGLYPQKIQSGEWAVYQKVTNFDEGNRSDLIVAHPDGTEKHILAKNLLADFLFIPERSQVVILDHRNKKIDTISLVTGEQRTVFDFEKFGVVQVGEGTSGYSPITLSPDKTKIVFSAGNDYTQSSRVFIVDLVDETKQPREIYKETNPRYSVKINGWDSMGKIYGYLTEASDGGGGGHLVITETGAKTTTPLGGKEFNGFYMLSPDGKYFINSQENPNGPLFRGMVDHRAYGVVKIIAAETGEEITIESNNRIDVSLMQWTSDSKYAMYKVFSYPEWSGKLSDTNVGKSVNSYAVYALGTKEKKTLNSMDEVKKWLVAHDPAVSHVVDFATDTSADHPDDKNLYIDGIRVDSVEKIDWYSGSPVFNVLGFIKL